MKKSTICLLFWFTGLLSSVPFMSNGQGVNVRSSVAIAPIYSDKLDEVIKSNIMQITLTNFSQEAITVYLMGMIRSDKGVLILPDASYRPAYPIMLEPSVRYVLTQQDLETVIPLAQIEMYGVEKEKATRGILPPGKYTVCINVFDYNTNKLLSGSDLSGCSNEFNIMPVVITSRIAHMPVPTINPGELSPEQVTFKPDNSISTLSLHRFIGRLTWSYLDWEENAGPECPDIYPNQQYSEMCLGKRRFSLSNTRVDLYLVCKDKVPFYFQKSVSPGSLDPIFLGSAMTDTAGNFNISYIGYIPMGYQVFLKVKSPYFIFSGKTLKLDHSENGDYDIGTWNGIANTFVFQPVIKDEDGNILKEDNFKVYILRRHGFYTENPENINFVNEGRKAGNPSSNFRPDPPPNTWEDDILPEQIEFPHTVSYGIAGDCFYRLFIGQSVSDEYVLRIVLPGYKTWDFPIETGTVNRDPGSCRLPLVPKDYQIQLPCAIVKGRLVSENGGVPLSEYQVLLIMWDDVDRLISREVFVYNTKEDGTFFFRTDTIYDPPKDNYQPQLNLDKYTLSFRSPEGTMTYYNDYEYPFRLNHRGEIKNLGDIRMEVRDCKPCFVVKNSEGEPVPGARLKWNDQVAPLWTKKDGFAEGWQIVGNHQVTVHALGYMDKVLDIEVTCRPQDVPGPGIRSDDGESWAGPCTYITMEHPSLKIDVKDAGPLMAPVAWATVQLEFGTSLSQIYTVDYQGSVTIPQISQKQFWVVIKGPEGSNYIPVRYPGNMDLQAGITEMFVYLKKGMEIKGRVLSGKAGVGNAMVSIRDYNRGLITATSDAYGDYILHGVPFDENKEHNISAWAGGFLETDTVVLGNQLSSSFDIIMSRLPFEGNPDLAGFEVILTKCRQFDQANKYIISGRLVNLPENKVFKKVPFQLQPDEIPFTNQKVILLRQNGGPTFVPDDDAEFRTSLICFDLMLFKYMKVSLNDLQGLQVKTLVQQPGGNVKGYIDGDVKINLAGYFGGQASSIQPAQQDYHLVQPVRNNIPSLNSLGEMPIRAIGNATPYNSQDIQYWFDINGDQPGATWKYNGIELVLDQAHNLGVDKDSLKFHGTLVIPIRVGGQIMNADLKACVTLSETPTLSYLRMKVANSTIYLDEAHKWELLVIGNESRLNSGLDQGILLSGKLKIHNIPKSPVAVVSVSDLTLTGDGNFRGGQYKIDKNALFYDGFNPQIRDSINIFNKGKFFPDCTLASGNYCLYLQAAIDGGLELTGIGKLTGIDQIKDDIAVTQFTISTTGKFEFLLGQIPIHFGHLADRDGDLSMNYGEFNINTGEITLHCTYNFNNYIKDCPAKKLVIHYTDDQPPSIDDIDLVWDVENFIILTFKLHYVEDIDSCGFAGEGTVNLNLGSLSLLYYKCQMEFMKLRNDGFHFWIKWENLDLPLPSVPLSLNEFTGQIVVNNVTNEYVVQIKHAKIVPNVNYGNGYAGPNTWTYWFYEYLRQKGFSFIDKNFIYIDVQDAKISCTHDDVQFQGKADLTILGFWELTQGSFNLSFGRQYFSFDGRTDIFPCVGETSSVFSNPQMVHLELCLNPDSLFIVFSYKVETHIAGIYDSEVMVCGGLNVPSRIIQQLAEIPDDLDLMGREIFPNSFFGAFLKFGINLQKEVGFNVGCALGNLHFNADISNNTFAFISADFMDPTLIVYINNEFNVNASAGVEVCIPIPILPDICGGIDLSARGDVSGEFYLRLNSNRFSGHAQLRGRIQGSGGSCSCGSCDNICTCCCIGVCAGFSMCISAGFDTAHGFTFAKCD